MQFERGKPPETPNAPDRAARIKDERWRSAGPGFEPGRAGPRLSLTSSQDEKGQSTQQANRQESYVCEQEHALEPYNTLETHNNLRHAAEQHTRKEQLP
jgi:hypothetical protein